MKNYKSQVHRFLGRGLEVNFLNPFENGKTFQDKLFPKRFGTLTQTKPQIHMGGQKWAGENRAKASLRTVYRVNLASFLCARIVWLKYLLIFGRKYDCKFEIQSSQIFHRCSSHLPRWALALDSFLLNPVLTEWTVEQCFMIFRFIFEQLFTKTPRLHVGFPQMTMCDFFSFIKSHIGNRSVQCSLG